MRVFTLKSGILLAHPAGVAERGHVDRLLLALLIAREFVDFVQLVRR